MFVIRHQLDRMVFRTNYNNITLVQWKERCPSVSGFSFMCLSVVLVKYVEEKFLWYFSVYQMM